MTRTQRPRLTLANALTRSVAKGLALFVGFATVFILANGTDMRADLTPDTPASATTPAPADRAAALADRNGCWTGEAPADMDGELPGRVVVIDRQGPRIGGTALVGKALDQAFTDTDHGLTIVAFCR